jgi:hypothetical protein
LLLIFKHVQKSCRRLIKKIFKLTGNISKLNELAKETGAIAIIHSGDFGFYGTLSETFVNLLYSINCLNKNKIYSFLYRGE